MDADAPLYIGLLKHSPLGDLWLAVSERGLVAVEWADHKPALEQYLTKRLKRPSVINAEKTASAIRQLGEYLDGDRTAFTFPIDWRLLRPFQREVLRRVFAIPYGETRTYGEIAHQIGRVRAARAVGRANATNPMPLVIPCHRVVGADGKLRGYGGGQGLKTKEWLLKLEGAVIA
jgi:O-6-methylguanine DNA methyltransferase